MQEAPQHSLAEGEVGLVSGRHAATFSGASFPGRAGRRGGGVTVSLNRVAMPSLERRVVLSSSELSSSYLLFFSLNLFLDERVRTKPVSLGHLGDFGLQAVHVAASITAVTQQQAIIVVSLPADLAILDNKHRSEAHHLGDVPQRLLQVAPLNVSLQVGQPQHGQVHGMCAETRKAGPLLLSSNNPVITWVGFVFKVLEIITCGVWIWDCVRLKKKTARLRSLHLQVAPGRTTKADMSFYCHSDPPSAPCGQDCCLCSLSSACDRAWGGSLDRAWQEGLEMKEAERGGVLQQEHRKQVVWGQRPVALPG
ncbi:hypothetical protein F7725_000960 [Dissostichus mawsoni]|uniref:Uncharacterized protein n=1 Tax=Dissostichus mawsoni TaxID=36200 RepID=A0A7J5ZFW9_DISMA|nr:hypothetical protein F7725_000960 [Dissostichus mawsoni]